MSNNSISKFVRIPDLISLANGVLGLLSIVCSVNKQHEWAALLITLAGVADFFDGRVARRLNISSEFGKQLDSLCDQGSFIIAPMIFVYTIESIDIAIRILLCSCYVLAGLLRLARFNVTGTLNGGKYFEGMPVPFSIPIVLSFFIFQFFGISLLYWITLFFIHAGLMVSTVKIRKI
ncbi:MAG: CDP-alcohol phosphatidyltransferase family protein [Sphingobacteriaceae bacterium]|nr:CDP-alcohol phosphatidyltransferase family protein [Sphingobacteriaceae bacterium]